MDRTEITQIVDRDLFLQQAVEDFQQGVDDGLAKGIGRGRNLLVTLVARRKTEVAAFLSNNRLCPLDCPLCEIAAISDRDSFYRGDLVYSFLDNPRQGLVSASSFAYALVSIVSCCSLTV